MNDLPAVRLSLLGAFRLERDGRPIPLPTRKVESLLAYLVLHPEQHAREKLAALFWGDVRDEQARRSLRVALTTLRKQLGDDIVLTDREPVQINPDYPLWVDAKEFQIAVLRQAQDKNFRLQIGEMSQSAINNLQSAIELFRGELLSDFYDDWILGERERYHALYTETLLQLTRQMRARGEYERAIEYAQRLLASENTHEPAHQHLMFCDLAVGNRSAALKQYEECRRILRAEVGVEPSPETTALIEWIKQASARPKTQDALPTNLPIPLTSFIGRQREMAEVKRLLVGWSDSRVVAPSDQPTKRPSFDYASSCARAKRRAGRSPAAQDMDKPDQPTTRLLTLTGAGGCGKTRLAVQVATDLRDAFKDGVWWIELAALTVRHTLDVGPRRRRSLPASGGQAGRGPATDRMDDALVPQAVAKALGLREVPGAPLDEMLSEHLRLKQALLVLDNCEHLVTACARLAEQLLSRCPDLKILTTSREALALIGETVWHVPSLALPPMESKGQSPMSRLQAGGGRGTWDASAILSTSVGQYESVRLFVERATAVQSSFALTAQNASAVAQVCRRLGGIPLAIELAAARMKLLSVEQIAERLDDRFNLLSVGSRTALPRYQTLRAAIDWSYGLLTDAERMLFRRLSIFAGSFTLDAAEEVASGVLRPAQDDQWRVANEEPPVTRHQACPEPTDCTVKFTTRSVS